MPQSTLPTFYAAPLAALMAFSLLTVPSAQAAPPKKPVSPPKTKAAAPPNNGEATKGTEQIKGGDGVFGTIYTVVNNNGHGVNVQFLKARYTLEPHKDYDGTMPGPEDKLFVLTFAIKNPNKDSDIGAGIDITLVDENENNYGMRSGATRLASNGSKELSMTLKPGQGVGQDPVANELSLAITVPGNAKIKKILLNSGRAALPDEKVLRFNIAGTTGGSPKNVIEPLPKYVADPTDPTGATTLDTASAVLGKYYPDGHFAIRLDSVALLPDAVLKGSKADDGRVWAVAAMTCKNIDSKEMSTFYLGGEKIVLRDTDGEKYQTEEAGKRKATRDEEAGSVPVEVNEEYSFRYFFQVPKDIKLKSLFFQSGGAGHNYQWDLTPAATP